MGRWKIGRKRSTFFVRRMELANLMIKLYCGGGNSCNDTGEIELIVVRPISGGDW